MVTTFHLDLVPKFLFIYIAHDKTAARLRDQGPALFFCVAAATMGSTYPLRKTVAEETIKHFESCGTVVITIFPLLSP